MRFVYRRKIGTRLGWSFAIVVGLTILLGVIALVQIKTLSNLTRDLYNHPLVVSNAIRDIRGNILTIHRLTKDLILSQTDQQMQEIVKQIDLEDQNALRSFDLLYERFLGDKADVDAARKAFLECQSIRINMINLFQDGRKDQAIQIIRDEDDPHVFRMNEYLEVISNFAKQKAASFVDMAQKSQQRHLWIMSGLVGLISLAAVLAGIIVTRSITRPLAYVMEQINKVAAGNLDHKIALDSGDEIGLLAQTVDNMTASLKKITASRNELDAANQQLQAHEQQLQAANQQLLDSERRYRALFEGPNDAIFLMEGNVFLDCNEATLRMFGCDAKSDILGHRPSDFSPKTQPDGQDSLQKSLPIIQSVLEGQSKRFEWKHTQKNGLMFDAEVSLTRVKLGGKTFIQAIVRDITERKRMEKERLDHLWFLESMERINQSIQSTNDLEQMIGNTLDAVLSIFNCDRVYLSSPFDLEAPSFHVPMERTRPEYAGVFALGVEVPMDPEIAATIQLVKSSSESIIFGPGSKHQVPSSATRNFGIQAYIEMAVYPKTSDAWIFGVQQCSYPRVWTLQEKKLFEAIGRRLGDGLTSLLILRNLHESESKLAQAQHIAHIGHWDFDVNSQSFTGSEETFRILGLSLQERILDMTQILNLVHSEDRQRIAQMATKIIEVDAPRITEYRIIRPDGQVRCIQSQWDIIKDKSGRPCRLFGTSQDITEYKSAQDALHREQEFTSRIMETSPVGIAAVNRHGEITFANACAEKILGLTRDEVTKRSYNAPDWHITDYDGNPLTDDKLPFRQVMDSGKAVYDIHHAIERPDGQRILLSINAAPVFSAANKFEGMVATIEDVTERKQSENALKESESKFRSLFDTMSEGVALHELITDQNGKATDYRIVEVNPAYMIHTGLKMEDARNQLASIFYGADSPPYLDLFAYVAQTGAPMYFETYFPPLKKYFDVSVFSPKPGWFATVFTDVTQHKQTQQELRKSEEKFMKAFHSSPVLMAISTIQEGKFLEVNDVFLKTLGFEREEVIDKTAFELNLYADPNQRDILLQAVKDHGHMRNMECMVRDRNGRLHCGLMSAEIIELQNTQYLLSIMNDITDRKKIEDALRESEEKYRALVENSLEGIGISKENQTLFANPALLNIFGYESLDEFLHIPLLEHVAPESRDMVLSIMEQRQQGNTSAMRFEYKIIRKNGETRDVEISSNRVIIDGQPCMLSTFRDITELKKAYEQLQLHQTNMAHLQRVSELGELATGLAHEINQPLCAIENYAQACLRFMETKPDSARLADAIKDIRDQAERAGKIIHRVRGLVRKKQPHFEFTRVKDILQEAVDLMSAEARKRGIQMALDFAEDIPPVYADFILIEQVAMNLIRNGFDAMDNPQIQKKELTITARTGSNTMVEVSISDTGCGISQENMNKIFRSFFTTKSGGLGIGLSLSKAIIESHFGQIWATANANGGATFHFTLPTRSRTDEA